MKNKLEYFFIIIITFLVIDNAKGQKHVSDLFPEFNILQDNCPTHGYIFISSTELKNSSDSNYIAIVDNAGKPIFYRTVNGSVSNFSVQPNGYLSYFSHLKNEWCILDSSYNEIDTFKMDSYEINGADFIILDDGSSIILGFEERLQDMSSIVDGGRSNATIKESVIQILDKNKNISLTWNSSDYFEITDANENSPSLDLTADVIDYIHIADIEIDSDTSFMISCKFLDEITKVDKKTGAIIWRLGGKNNQFTFLNDNVRFSQPTSLSITDEGYLQIFDSGLMNTSKKPSIIIYELNEFDKTAKLIERRMLTNYDNEAKSAGNQLYRSNNVVYWGDNKPSLTEYNSNGTIALELDYSEHSVSSKIYKSDWKTNLFEPVVDSINFGMWDYTIYRYILILKNNSDKEITITSIENSSDAYYTDQEVPFAIPAGGNYGLMISYFPETIPIGVVKDDLIIAVDSDSQRIAQKVKMIGYRDDFIYPDVQYFPESGSVDVGLDTIITIIFTEPLRLENNREIEYSDLNELIVLKKDNEYGNNVEFDASISTNKDRIYIKPRNLLQPSARYYLNINGQLEDYYNNQLLTQSVTFSTTENANLIIENSGYTNTYPNPADSYITISNDKGLIKEIEIYNLSGNCVRKYSNLNTNQYKTNIEELENGVYVIIIRNSMNHQSKIKLIKQ